MGYIYAGYCTPNGEVSQCAVETAGGGPGQGTAQGAIKTVTYWLCSSNILSCDSNGHNSEGSVNVTEFASQAQAATIPQDDDNSDAYAAGWQINQWAVEVSNGLPSGELSKVERSLTSAAAICNVGQLPPFHAERFY